MRVFFDPGVTFQKSHDEEYIVYSPANHLWIRVNPCLEDLLQIVISDEGVVNSEKIIHYFQEQHTISITEEEILDQIEKMIELQVFFRSIEDLALSEQATLQEFAFPEKPQYELVVLHPTMRCNLSCTYCFNRQNVSVQHELTTAEWIEVFERIQHHPVQEIIITGGEPLLRSDLETILAARWKTDAKVSLLSNGTLLEDRLPMLMPLVDLIVVSLDSLSSDVNALNRGEFGFDQILKVLQKASQLDPGKIKVRSVITKYNADSILDFRTRVENEYGVECILVPVIPHRLEDVELIPDEQVLIRGKIGENLFEQGQSVRKFRCGATCREIAIGPDGTVYPCQNFVCDEFQLTNIFYPTWEEEVVHSKISKEFRELSVNSIEKCKSCSYRYFCGGGCPGTSYKVYGNLHSHVGFYCTYLKHLAQCRLENTQVTWEIR